MVHGAPLHAALHLQHQLEVPLLRRHAAAAAAAAAVGILGEVCVPPLALLLLLLLRVPPVRLGRAPRRGAAVAAAAAAAAAAEVERECGPRCRRVLRVLLRLLCLHALVCGLRGGGGLARRLLRGTDLGLRLYLAPLERLEVARHALHLDEGLEVEHAVVVEVGRAEHTLELLAEDAQPPP